MFLILNPCVKMLGRNAGVPKVAGVTVWWWKWMRVYCERRRGMKKVFKCLEGGDI